MQRHPVLLLSVLMLVACIAVGLVHQATRERILHNRQLAQLRPLHQLLGDSSLRLEPFALPAHPLLGPVQTPAYRASDGAQPLAVILPATADGYGGAIQLQVGFNPDGRVIGVRLLSHRETPGLGARMEVRHSDWLRQFSGPGPWALRSEGGQLDHLTGATVTSRAVTAAVEQARQYVAGHVTELFGKPKPAAQPGESDE